MVHMNISLPNDLARDLKRMKNKRRLITEALRERVRLESKKVLKKLLIEGYKKSVIEDRELNKDWDTTTGDGID